MSIEVYLTSDLTQEMNDSLQQIKWEFPVSFKQFEEKKAEGLQIGDIYIDSEGPKVVALAGQRPVSFSWLKLQAHWRSEASRMKASPILRALGAQAGDWVIDATCGTGRDSSYLIHHGLNVMAFERNQTIYFLLKVSQFIEGFLPERLKIKFGQASNQLDSDFSDYKVFFDPMFDDGQGRRAKTKKNMEVFHHIVGADLDAIAEAQKLRAISKRLVIKRSPRDGELLAKPNSTWQTKSVRFDLYL